MILLSRIIQGWLLRLDRRGARKVSVGEVSGGVQGCIDQLTSSSSSNAPSVVALLIIKGIAFVEFQIPLWLSPTI